jgi:adenylate kinase
MEQKVASITTWLGSGSINIFGLPFSGKDTQARRLADLFGGVMMSSGDILRRNQDNEELQRIMASGQIIPSDLFERIVVPDLSREELHGKPLILSEVGRMEGEQHVILRATSASGHPQKAVILLKLSDEEVWHRFDASKQEGDRGARADDNTSVLQTRLDSYHQKVTPVIEYYRQTGLLIEIDGSRSRDEVTEEILQCLYTKATP